VGFGDVAAIQLMPRGGAWAQSKRGWRKREWRKLVGVNCFSIGIKQIAKKNLKRTATASSVPMIVLGSPRSVSGNF